VIVTALLLIGGLAGAAGTGFAFYNVESGHDPDQALVFQIGFTWIAVGLVEAALVSVVLAVDPTLRAIVARLANLC